MLEDVEVQLPMVFDLLGPSSISGGELGHGGLGLELVGKKGERESEWIGQGQWLLARAENPAAAVLPLNPAVVPLVRSSFTPPTSAVPAAVPPAVPVGTGTRVRRRFWR